MKNILPFSVTNSTLDIELNANFYPTWQMRTQTSTRLACLAQPPNFYQNTEPHSFNLQWFLSHLLGLWFQHRIKDIFIQINMGDGRLENRHCFTSDLGSNVMLMGFFSPPHGPFGEIYALCCGFIQDMCVCAKRKVQWAHAGNMQAFVGIFLFFPGSALDFFLGSFLLLNYFAFLEK